MRGAAGADHQPAEPRRPRGAERNRLGRAPTRSRAARRPDHHLLVEQQRPLRVGLGAGSVTSCARSPGSSSQSSRRSASTGEAAPAGRPAAAGGRSPAGRPAASGTVTRVPACPEPERTARPARRARARTRTDHPRQTGRTTTRRRGRRARPRFARRPAPARRRAARGRTTLVGRRVGRDAERAQPPVDRRRVHADPSSVQRSSWRQSSIAGARSRRIARATRRESRVRLAQAQHDPPWWRAASSIAASAL